MANRFANWLRGRGFQTDAEYSKAKRVDGDEAQQIASQEHPNSRMSRSVRTEAVYVIQCLNCGKKFTRKSESTTLNPHKSPDGFPCNGTTGFIIGLK